MNISVSQQNPPALSSTIGELSTPVNTHTDAMKKRVSADPLSLIPRILSRLYTLWLVWTYPFASVGKGFWTHYTLDVRRLVSPYIKLGKGVGIDQDVWLNIPFVPESPDPVIILEDGCRIGRRCMISAKNRVQIGPNVIFGPSVLITDHCTLSKTSGFRLCFRESLKAEPSESRKAAGSDSAPQWYAITENLSLARIQSWARIP